MALQRPACQLMSPPWQFNLWTDGECEHKNGCGLVAWHSVQFCGMSPMNVGWQESCWLMSCHTISIQEWVHAIVMESGLSANCVYKFGKSPMPATHTTFGLCHVTS